MDVETRAKRSQFDNVTYSVRKALLCNASKYFVKALDGPFTERLDRTLKLPGCDHDTFKLFLYWLCNRELPPVANAPDDDLSVETIYASFTQRTKVLIRLWCLADACLMPKLQNTSMSALMKLQEGVRVDMEVVEHTIEIAPPDSPLRKVVMDEVAYDYNDGNYTDEEESQLALMPGVLQDLLKRFRQGLNRDAPSVGREKRSSYMVAER